MAGNGPAGFFCNSPPPGRRSLRSEFCAIVSRKCVSLSSRTGRGLSDAWLPGFGRRGSCGGAVPDHQATVVRITLVSRGRPGRDWNVNACSHRRHRSVGSPDRQAAGVRKRNRIGDLAMPRSWSYNDLARKGCNGTGSALSPLLDDTLSHKQRLEARGTMVASPKGRRSITINGRRFLWWIADRPQEGFWALDILSEDKRFRFTYPLVEQTLIDVARDPRHPPLPPWFDGESLTPRHPAVLDFRGSPDHAPVTPQFVRELVLWLLEHEPMVDIAGHPKTCIWKTMQ